MKTNWKIAVVDGPDKGREFPIQGSEPLVIGRGSDSHTQIRDPQLSRVHCQVELLDSRVVLVDRGSSSGTFVSGIRLDGPHELKRGSEFLIGESRLRLDSDSPLDAPTLTPQPVLSPQQTVPTLGKLMELQGEVFLRFRMDQLVATGRNSVVYKGYDTKRDRVVAMKILRPQVASTDVQRDRFIRAMRTMLPIIHPNIVRTRKAGRRGPYCWAALDWVEGMSVTKLIDNIGIGGVLPWQDVWRVAVHVGRALLEANKQGIIHRNVTPSNILRRNIDRSFLLTDLIFARALEYTDAPALTRPGDVIGELGYMSPEQLLDSANVDARCDQYGLGSTLYALLTGAPPYRGSNISEFIEKLRTTQPRYPAESQMGMDERFCDCVMRMLHRDPAARFESPQVLLKDLARVGKLGGIEADWSDWV